MPTTESWGHTSGTYVDRDGRRKPGCQIVAEADGLIALLTVRTADQAKRAAKHFEKMGFTGRRDMSQKEIRGLQRDITALRRLFTAEDDRDSAIDSTRSMFEAIVRDSKMLLGMED